MTTGNPSTETSGKPDDIPRIVRQRFYYEPETGVFVWRARPVSDFSSERIARNWNTRFAGKLAFTGRNSDGYAQVELLIDGKRTRLFGHNAAFAYVMGRLPFPEADHRNRVRDDNRFVNLREATRAENARNSVRPGRFLAGARPRNSRWESRISCNRKSFYLGVYDTEEMAHAAYCSKAAELHGEFAAISHVNTAHKNSEVQ